jgi:hypothetical protein
VIEYERLIDDIKHALMVESQPTATSGQSRAERVAALAADYLAKCQVANERVRQCSHLLRRGLRSEAIQLAEHAPNLIDLVTLLDFAERSQWCDLLGQYDLPLPPELMIDVAADLNAAYALEQPVAVLLKRHRLQALGRAPLKFRIATMKEIAKADPSNPIWNQDLSKFEKARHEQIQKESQAAAKMMNVGILEALDQELREPGWLMPPPPTLVAATGQRYAQLRTACARKELEQLEPKLLAAHAEFDLEIGRQWRDQWESRVATAGLNDADPLSERVSPVLEWIAAEDRREEDQSQYEAAITALEEVLDGVVTLAKLRGLYEGAVRHEQGIPQTLDERVRERVVILERAASRRSKLIVAGSVVGVLFLTGAIVAGVSFKSHRDAVNSTVAVIEQLLGEGRLTSAEKYLSDLNASAPQVAAAPEVVAMAAKMASLLANESQRQKAFRQAMDAAIEAADFDHATFESLALAETRLNRDVKPLAAIRRDQTEVTTLEERIIQSRVEVQKRLDDAFTAKIELLLTQQTKLEDSKDPATKEAVSEQLRKISALLDSGGQISDSPIERLQDLLRRAKRLDKAIASREQMTRRVEAIASAVGDKQAYLTALATYVQEFPGTERAKGFEQIQQEQSIWQAIDDWQRWRTRWNRISWTDLDSEAAGELLKDAEKLLANNDIAALPYAVALRDCLPYLAAIAQRGPNHSVLIKPLLTLFNNRSISGLRFVQVRDSGNVIKRYYVQEAVKSQPQSGKVTFRYITDFSFKTKTFSTSLESIVSPASGGSAPDAPAPQDVVAQEALRLLSKHSGWEETFFTILEHIEQNQVMDPLLKALMFSQIVNVAGKGSFALTKAFAPFREELERADLLMTCNWLDPDDADAKLERVKAANALQRLPDLKQIKAIALEDLQTLRVPLPGNLRWVGCLLQDDSPSGSWRCHLSPAEARPQMVGDLVVAQRADWTVPMQVELIGKLEDGKVTLRPGVVGFRDGRPVFLSISK